MSQLVKNPPVMQETLIPSQSRDDPLEKEMVTHASILAWRITWTEETDGKARGISHVHGIPRIRHNWATKWLQPNLKVHFVVGSEYLILLTCQYSPNWSIYSTQAKSKCQKAFCTNRLPDSKLHMEMQRKSTHTTLKKEQSWRAKTTWFQELL